MIKYRVGIPANLKGNDQVTVSVRPEPNDTSDLQCVRSITAKNTDEAAQLYIKLILGGKAGIKPKRN